MSRPSWRQLPGTRLLKLLDWDLADVRLDTSGVRLERTERPERIVVGIERCRTASANEVDLLVTLDRGQGLPPVAHVGPRRIGNGRDGRDDLGRVGRARRLYRQ